MGSPLVVRLMVPAWIVNSTPLPISAAVVRMQRPQPPAPEAGGAHTSARDHVPLMKVDAAMNSIKVFETGFQFKCAFLSSPLLPFASGTACLSAKACTSVCPSNRPSPGKFTM